MQYDQGGDQPQMETGDLEHLLADLGMQMKEAGLEKVKSTLAGDDDIITMDEFMGWYSTSSSNGDQKGAAQSDSEGADSGSEMSDSD